MLTVILITSLLFLASCSSNLNDNLNDVPLEKQCKVDADCVKDVCCHASDAVNKDYAPNCGGLLCTQECQPNTLDCGQGKISCDEGQCVATIDNPLPNGLLSS